METYLVRKLIGVRSAQQIRVVQPQWSVPARYQTGPRITRRS